MTQHKKLTEILDDIQDFGTRHTTKKDDLYGKYTEEESFDNEIVSEHLLKNNVVVLPKKFWIFFNVPGFYCIEEYDVERMVIDADGNIAKIYGRNKHQAEVVYAIDFGRLVFFTEEEAKETMKEKLRRS